MDGELPKERSYLSFVILTAARFSAGFGFRSCTHELVVYSNHRQLSHETQKQALEILNRTLDWCFRATLPRTSTYRGTSHDTLRRNRSPQAFDRRLHFR